MTTVAAASAFVLQFRLGCIRISLGRSGLAFILRRPDLLHVRFVLSRVVGFHITGPLTIALLIV